MKGWKGEELQSLNLKLMLFFFRFFRIKYQISYVLILNMNFKQIIKTDIIYLHNFYLKAYTFLDRISNVWLEVILVTSFLLKLIDSIIK
jgi:hypothetical protein